LKKPKGNNNSNSDPILTSIIQFKGFKKYPTFYYIILPKPPTPSRTIDVEGNKSS